MPKCKALQVLVWTSGIGCIVFPTAALAYVDLSTGSVLIQAVLGGIAVGGTLVKVYWTKLVGLLRRDGVRKGASEDEHQA
jgi:hypothetical protein